MSRNTTNGRGRAPSTRPPDEDIAALFAAQADDVTVPADLDAVIRASAREEAPAGDATASAIDPVHDARADGTRSGGAPLFRQPPRSLAVAAVLVLAFALVPLVRQAPDPAHDRSDDASTPATASETRTGAAGDTDGDGARTVGAKRSAAAPRATGEAAGAARSAPAIDALLELASTTDAEAMPPDVTAARSNAGLGNDGTARPGAEAESAVEARPDSVPDAARGSAPVAAAERLRTRPPTAAAADVPPPVKRSSGRVDSLAGAGARAALVPDPFEGHRRTPAAWLERLRERLRVDGFTPALRDEYRRFRSRHPDVEPAFDPETVAREAGAPRR